MKDGTLYNAFNHWEELSSTKEQRVAYEERTKQIMDEEAAKREFELRKQDARREGLKEGREEGREEGRAKGREEGKQESLEGVARKLLEEGSEIKFVIRTTGLTKDKVLEILGKIQ